jgi:beta-N-acetylhexosaminidase
MTGKKPLAAVFGCSGLELTAAERVFFRDADPFGFILFARNCRTPDQVRALTHAMRDAVGRADAPVLIDQEGGRVARLGPPNWRSAPSSAVFGRLAETDEAAAGEAVRLNYRLMAAELCRLGITVDCAPVLDVPGPGADPVIGERAFGRAAETAATLGRAAVEGLLDGGILAVIKHIPGHGRALVDSHKDVAVVDASLEELQLVDFAPFRALRDAPWAMTAHVVFAALDPENPATTSALVIKDAIRGEIGFAGVLISDDLAMEALSGGMGARAAAALDAGCDLVLNCNGAVEEMGQICEAIRPISAPSAVRIKRAEGKRRGAADFDEQAAMARLEYLLRGVVE